MTFSITEGHWCWCQSISHIWFLSVYYCNYTELQKFLTPFCFCCKLFDWDIHNDRLSSTCYEWLNLWQDCAMNAQCGKTCADHRAEWYDPLYWKPLTCPGGSLTWPLLPAGHQRRSSGQLFWTMISSISRLSVRQQFTPIAKTASWQQTNLSMTFDITVKLDIDWVGTNFLQSWKNYCMPLAVWEMSLSERWITKIC